jgi:imidazolonepropionase-like amidohydrolase
MNHSLGRASDVFAVVATILLPLALASAQSLPGAKLSQTVKEFVKYDDALLALTHVRVIDGTGRAARADQTVVLRDGKIAALGDAASTAIPVDAKVLDLTDHTIFPGIVGMHDHLFYPQPTNIEGRRVRGVLQFDQQSSFTFPRLYLAGGVTSLRTTASAEPYADLNLKTWIDEGKIPGPKIHVTSPYMEGKGNFRLQVHELTGPEDARNTAEFWADQGVTSFKAFMHITRDELKEVINVAHKRGLTVTGHLCSITFREAAELGIDNLEHGFANDSEWDPGKQPGICPPPSAARDAVLDKLTPDDPQLRELFQILVQHHVAITSTLVPYEDPGPLQQRVLDEMSPQAQAGYLAQRVDRAGQPAHPDAVMREVERERAFVQAGGLLLSGPDPTGIGGNLAGFGDQRQIELLVGGGFTPLEAIHISTENGARFLREDDRIGTLVVGKVADLVVVHGDPSTKISDIENVEVVFKDGVGYDSGKLIESVRGLVGLR